MIYIATYIEVGPNSAHQAIELIRQYRQGSSNLHLLQETSRHHRFVMIESWNDDASFQAHESASHTAQFRSTLKTIHNSPNDQRKHLGFAVGPEPRASGHDALAVVTHVDVPPPRREETEVLLKQLAVDSRRDPGNLRYDIYQQYAPRTNHFTVFAVWRDDDAFASHESQRHTVEFREALGPMLGAPYDDRLYRQVT